MQRPSVVTLLAALSPPHLPNCVVLLMMHGLLLTILMVQTEAAVWLLAADVDLPRVCNRYSWTFGRGTSKQWTRP